MISVVIRKNGEIVSTKELEPGAFDIGRAEDCEIWLEDISVSRRHARLHVSEDRIFIEDLDSGNGCWFNGRRIRNQTLVDGDEVVLDPFSLHVQIEEMSVTGMVTAELTDLGEDATHLISGDSEISLSEPLSVVIARWLVTCTC